MDILLGYIFLMGFLRIPLRFEKLFIFLSFREVSDFDSPEDSFFSIWSHSIFYLLLLKYTNQAYIPIQATAFSFQYRRCWVEYSDPCENQPYKGHFTSKLNSKMVPVLPSLDPSHIYIFHLLPTPVYLTGFYFCFFPVFLVIFISLSSNNNHNYSLTWNHYLRK